MKENRCSRRKSSILVGVLAVMCVSAAAVEAAPTINEFSASTAGTDVEYVEIFGSPNTDYSSYTVLEIEGDGAGAGVIDEIITVGTTDAAGFWLANLPANSLENGSLTLLLVEGFIGALGMDLDADNDGAFDTSPWLSMVDAVAVNDGGVGDVFYGAPVLGPNYDGISAFAPGGASRIPDSLDTDTAGDWVRNDFDLAGIPGQTGTAMLGEALNTPGGPNQVYEDQPDPPEVCGDPFTPIYVVQGNGLASPLAGTEVSIEGVVVGDFQNNSTPDSGDLDGFYVQDPLGDGDTATSDGLFVYAPGGLDVSFGDAVRVRGTVLEFGGLTQISVSQILVCSSGNLVSPAVVSLPVTSLEDLERHEGMLVVFPQELTISEYFNFDRFGEIVLTIGRQFQPTAIFPPGSLEAAELAAFNALSRITLDDGRTEQNPDPAIHPNGGVFDLSNLFRGGDIVQDVTGVLDDRFGRYGIQPVTGATLVPVNPRPDEPEDVGGSIKIAAFNVLNYFTTLDSRGANNAEEFTRQRDKIFAALARIDADVVGLIEIENNGTALDDLVDGLNQFIGQPLYVALQTGVIGTDEIAVAFIYKSSSVTPMGAFAVLDDPAFVDPAASGIPRNRPALAQTFMDNSSGGVVTAVVNHFKSKGSECGAGDDDPEQGNCNLTRTLAAQVLLDWLATDPTGSGDANVLILGDLNSYDKEQPIALITSAFVDLLRLFHGELAYTYVFNGQLGYLDYALASAGLLDEVTGATAWHINSDEPDLIDYDTTFKQDDQDALYAPDQFRSSDHDPVIVGLSLTPNAIRLLDRLLAAVRELELRRPLEGALSARVLVARELLADQKPRNDHVAIVSLKSLVRVVERWEGRLLTAEEAERLVHQTEIIIGVL